MGTYYVQAVLTDDAENPYVKGSKVVMTPTEVEITKAGTPKLELVYDSNKALDGAKIPFSATGETPDTVSIDAKFSVTGVTPEVVIEGTDIGFKKAANESYMPVSYTHLDVYKRQPAYSPDAPWFLENSATASAPKNSTARLGK